MLTIKEVFDSLSKEERIDYYYSLYLGDFLDYFYSKNRTSEERYKLVEDEPLRYANIANRDYAYISAVVHSICIEYKCKVPKWVIKEEYFLDLPYFAMDAKGNLRLILLRESPIYFRMRNIFVSENALSRV